MGLVGNSKSRSVANYPQKSPVTLVFISDLFNPSDPVNRAEFVLLKKF